MELAALLVFLAVFAGCGAVVFIISFFGTQTESYEEAIEKQRNKLNKEKAQKKEKKPAAEKKKKTKKVKEVKNNNILDVEEETVLVDPSGEIVEPVYIEPAQPKEVVVEKPKKEEKKKKEEKIIAKTVVPPAPVIVEEAVAVQAAPAPAAAPAPVAAPKPVEDAPEPIKEQPKKEKKMVIKEVAEIVPVVETEEKKKKKSGKENGKKKSSSYEDVLEIVRKVQLSSTEAQGVVDVLLLKQTGQGSNLNESTGGEWEEPGKESEAKKMTRQLAEIAEQLEEEKNKSSGLEKKMAAVRKEMTDGKSQLNTLKREMEEMNRKKVLETNNYNTTVQQLKVELNTSSTYNIQMEAKYQQEMRSLKEQLDRAQISAPPSDTKLVAELEKIKTENAELSNANQTLNHNLTAKCSEVESTTASLQQQLSDLRTATSEEKEQLSSQLTKAQEAHAQVEAKLETANRAQSSLADEKCALEGLLEQAKSSAQPDVSAQVTNNQLESQLSAITAAKHQLQSELTTLKDKLSEKEIENTRIMEENERLSEQVASSVERPAAEGEEAVNGHSEHQPQVEVAVKEAPALSSDLEDKYSKLTIQLKQRESRCAELEEELSNSKLDFQKLNSKNDEVCAAYNQYKVECMTMLGNLFPSVECSEDSNLATIQTKAKQFIQDLVQKAEDASKVESLTEDIQKLEAQSASYKTILAQTENMLTTLQASVEGAEQEWKKKFEASESECKDLKSKVTELESKNTEILQKFKDATSLSEELAAEKSGKDLLAKKCSELQHLLTLGDKQLELANSKEEVLINGGEESEA